MTVEQALNVIKQCGAEYKGSLADHQNIQLAISVIDKALNNPDPKIENTPEQESDVG